MDRDRSHDIFSIDSSHFAIRPSMASAISFFVSLFFQTNFYHWPGYGSAAVLTWHQGFSL